MSNGIPFIIFLPLLMRCAQPGPMWGSFLTKSAPAILQITCTVLQIAHTMLIMLWKTFRKLLRLSKSMQERHSQFGKQWVEAAILHSSGTGAEVEAKGDWLRLLKLPGLYPSATFSAKKWYYAGQLKGQRSGGDRWVARVKAIYVQKCGWLSITQILIWWPQGHCNHCNFRDWE